MQKNTSVDTREVKIRKAKESDSEQVWTLMKELAAFEGYIDSFAITPDIVREAGFRKNPPDFYCLVADYNQEIVGILVYYFLPFTAQNRPAVFIKELYVKADFRDGKIGARLMQALREEAKANHCRQIKWTVAPWNTGSQRFYERLGARQDTEWLNYQWDI